MFMATWVKGFAQGTVLDIEFRSFAYDKHGQKLVSPSFVNTEDPMMSVWSGKSLVQYGGEPL